jgi:Phytanoyl-CoA dioxygenase (PhyH)
MTPAPMPPEEHARRLFDEGFAVFESAYDTAEVDALRSGIEELYVKLGSPPCYAADFRILGPALHVGAPGLIIAKLVERRPDFACRILKAPIVETMRRVLGRDMYLELTASVIADETRAFFAWHTHIGGQDDGAYRTTGQWPDIPRPRRIGTLLYLEDLDDDNGPLLIYPRAAGGPTAPPHDLGAQDWEGQIVVRAPRGTVVAMDECTWHAARQKRTPGLRILLGCNFVSRDAPRAPLIEHSLREHVDGGELLRSVVPPPQT